MPFTLPVGTVGGGGGGAGGRPGPVANFPVTAGPGQSVNRSQSGTYIVPGMQQNYNQLLDLNLQNYNRIAGAYQQGLGNLGQRLGSLYGGYAELNADSDRLMGESYRQGSQDIARQQRETQGRIQQSLISSGLGNSTVFANLANASARQAQQEYGRLALGLNQQATDRRNTIGLARQQSYLQGIGQETGLYAGLGGALANYRFANTAGDLTGQYADSASASAQGLGGYGGGRGGGGLLGDPNALRGLPPSLGGYNGGTVGGVTGYIGGNFWGNTGGGGGGPQTINLPDQSFQDEYDNFGQGYGDPSAPWDDDGEYDNFGQGYY